MARRGIAAQTVEACLGKVTQTDYFYKNKGDTSRVEYEPSMLCGIVMQARLVFKYMQASINTCKSAISARPDYETDDIAYPLRLSVCSYQFDVRPGTGISYADRYIDDTNEVCKVVSKIGDTIAAMEQGKVLFGRPFPTIMNMNSDDYYIVNFGSINRVVECPRCGNEYTASKLPKGHYETMACVVASNIKKIRAEGWDSLDGVHVRAVQSAGVEYLDIPIDTRRFVPEWVQLAIKAHKQNPMGLSLKEYLIKMKP